MFGNLTILMQNHLKPLSTMEGVNHGRHHDGVYNSTQHDHWKWKCVNFGELVWAGQHVKGFTMEHWYPKGFFLFSKSNSMWMRLQLFCVLMGFIDP